jgi:hypothetical protein
MFRRQKLPPQLSDIKRYKILVCSHWAWQLGSTSSPIFWEQILLIMITNLLLLILTVARSNGQGEFHIRTTITCQRGGGGTLIHTVYTATIATVSEMQEKLRLRPRVAFFSGSRKRDWQSSGSVQERPFLRIQKKRLKKLRLRPRVAFFCGSRKIVWQNSGSVPEWQFLLLKKKRLTKLRLRPKCAKILKMF